MIKPKWSDRVKVRVTGRAGNHDPGRSKITLCGTPLLFLLFCYLTGVWKTRVAAGGMLPGGCIPIARG